MDTLKMLQEFDRLALDRIAQLRKSGRDGDANHLYNVYRNMGHNGEASDFRYWIKYFNKTAKVA